MVTTRKAPVSRLAKVKTVTTHVPKTRKNPGTLLHVSGNHFPNFPFNLSQKPLTGSRYSKAYREPDYLWRIILAEGLVQ
jgi:hypothetical protein